jgi:hypothetical protein
MNLNEQISRIRGLIYELAPHSSGVQEFIAQVQEKPELLKHMNFRNMNDLLDYIDNASYEEFSQLRDEVNHFINRRKKYFQSEMDEFERAAQDLSRDEGIEVSVNQLLDAFEKAKEVKIPNDVWINLENTESNQIKKGEINKIKCNNKKKIIRERYSLLVVSSNEKIILYKMCKKGVKTDFFIDFMNELKNLDINNNT